jgi:hypothetical protein
MTPKLAHCNHHLPNPGSVLYVAAHCEKIRIQRIVLRILRAGRDAVHDRVPYPNAIAWTRAIKREFSATLQEIDTDFQAGKVTGTNRLALSIEVKVDFGH